MKAYITRPVDVYRPPYARRAVAVPRQSAFVATTNETFYLRDSTGNRRFWPVRCGRIDVASLANTRDQMYAEAVAAYRLGEQWHLKGDEGMLAQDEQSARQLTTELEHQVNDYLDRMSEQGVTEVSMRAVLKDALGLETGGDYIERAGRLGPQAAAAMARWGARRVKATGRGKNRSVIYRLPAS
jgi:putative DNA primase/helicase